MKRKDISSSPQMVLLLGGILLLLLACSLPARIAGILPTDTAEPTSTRVLSPTLAPDRRAKTPTLQPQAAPAVCYPGSWELNNISDLITPILTQYKVQDVKFTGTSGTMSISFTADGNMSFAAAQYHSLYSGKLGFIPISVDVLIDGSGSGNYSLDPTDSLLLTNPNFDGITFSASASSISIIPKTPLTTLIPALRFNSGQTANLGSTCHGDTMVINPGSASMPPLDFSRMP
jgi:hypothetical protein